MLYDMDIKMKYKYNKYWKDVKKICKLLFMAVIIDFWYKLDIIKFWLRDILNGEKIDSFIRSL